MNEVDGRRCRARSTQVGIDLPAVMLAVHRQVREDLPEGTGERLSIQVAIVDATGDVDVALKGEEARPFVVREYELRVQIRNR